MTSDKRYPAFLLILAVLLGFFLYTSGVFQKKPHDAPEGMPALKSSSSGPGPGEVRSNPAKTSLPIFPIDINKASTQELMLLPGIGEKTAQRIVEKRSELGGFKEVDDLTAVKWIGKVKLEKIRALVTVSRPVDRTSKPSQGNL